MKSLVHYHAMLPMREIFLCFFFFFLFGCIVTKSKRLFVEGMPAIHISLMMVTS